MSPQTSEQITATPAPVSPFKELAVPPPQAVPPWGRLRNLGPLFWSLLAVAILLNGAILFGIYLIRKAPKTVDVDPTRKIHIPYADNKALWQELARLPIQENGRIKPLQTACIEIVRSITGREKFEGNDPVAVVLSWMMTFEPESGAPDKPNVNRIAEISKKLGFDKSWDLYPFILCDYHELREKIYREARGKKAYLTEEELHGKYIEPHVLRSSEVLRGLVEEVREKRRKDKQASLSMLQSKAQEVFGRLHTFDRARAGSEFALVALDQVGPVWFPIDRVRFFVTPPATDQSGKALTGSIIWDRWLVDTRIRNDRLYRGKPMQAYPEKGVRQVYDAYIATQAAYRTGDEKKFADAAANLTGVLAEVSKEATAYPGTNTIGLELTFNKVNPFQKAWIWGLLAAFVLALAVGVLSHWPHAGSVLYYTGLASYLAALGWAIFGFYCRVSISGRPPVSDMYESIIWVSFMTAVFGLILELVYSGLLRSWIAALLRLIGFRRLSSSLARTADRPFGRRGYIALAGAVVSTLGFVLADQLPLNFSPNIKPISAVLRSQYWLIIHVLTIVSSYAALALAWGLGNINIGLIMFAPHRKDQIKTLSHFSYKAIQIGVVLLFLGTMLGGFWAAESWGRFWGWDPKEVWALIAFLVYIIPLHARYAGWVKDFGLAACSVICFSAVVMAWYGVNFILGAGLHSYGFGSGNNSWLYVAGLTNISLVVHAALRYAAAGRHLAAE